MKRSYCEFFLICSIQNNEKNDHYDIPRRQRVEQAQREKVEARLSALRQQPNRSPTNLIHVQAHTDQDQQDPVEELNEHEKEASKQAIVLLEQQSGYGSRPGTATGTNYNISAANIEI